MNGTDIVGSVRKIKSPQEIAFSRTVVQIGDVGMHAMASRKKITPGDIVNIDLCGVYNRYHANMALTFSMGEPHPEVARIWR